MADHFENEPSCPFDLSKYRSASGNGEASGRIDVRELLEEADRLYEKNDIAAAEKLLCEKLEEAVGFNDREGQLGILSELLGCSRKTGNRELGLWAADRSSELITELGMEGTATAGTIRLNAATTLREFGKIAEAMEFYRMSARAYSATIDPRDYRFAGLYNNFAACLEEAGETDKAEEYYKRALAVISNLPECGIEEALTYVNLACLYGERDPEDARIEECLMKAKELFDREDIPRDGYYAFNALKCVDAFSHFGFFRDASELRKRAERIYGVL